MALGNYEITYKALNGGEGIKSCCVHSASATLQPMAKEAAVSSLLISTTWKVFWDLFVFGEIVYSQVNSEDSSGLVTQPPPWAGCSKTQFIKSNLSGV